ncbi:MAG: hypothetical protein GX022_08610 [Clostridiaceae bacterium]|nr:hypothetical protein [Clostridiaceae bacterium]
MSQLFLAVLNMSLTANYVILFVILIRLLLKKVPKSISYALWVVVAFRLVVPFSLESMFSLMPRNKNVVLIPNDMIYQQSPQINNGVEAVDSFVNTPLPAPTVMTVINPLQIFVETGTYIWVLGILMLLVYSFISVLILKRQLQGAQFIERNIFEAKNLRTPFVLGLINPRIYLPVGLSKEEQNYILLHEQTHIQRKDHIIKIIAFLILSVHWYNPLVWIAFILMSMDMEMSCDEKVLKSMNEDVKKSYANTLLSLAAGKYILSGSPLAFGEGNIKMRIKNVLNYKKPKFWILLFSIIIAAVIGIGLAMNPKSEESSMVSFNGSSYRVKEIIYQDPMYSFGYTLDTAPKYCISSDFVLFSKQSSEDWVMYGKLDPYKISKQKLYTLFNQPSDNVYEAVNNTKLIYRTDTADDAKTFYLVLQLENGDVLLAVGYDNEDFRNIRWLFGLEKLSEIADLVEKNLSIIMSSRNNASDPYDYIQEHQKEYEEIIKLGGEEALQYMLSQFKRGNAEGLRGYIMMQLCKELLGVRNNVTDETLTPQEWYDALSIRQEVKLPDFEYDGNDPIEKLVYATEIEKNSQPQRGFTIVAPKIFGSYEENGMLKVFVTTFSATYKLYGNVLEEVGGSVVPSAITYKKDNNGNYVLEKYEQAQDGAYWQPSIKKFCTMPVSGKKIPGLADRIIKHYSNYDDIRTLQRENLFKHLKANDIKSATLFNSSGEIEFTMNRPQYIN